MDHCHFSYISKLIIETLNFNIENQYKKFYKKGHRSSSYSIMATMNLILIVALYYLQWNKVAKEMKSMKVLGTLMLDPKVIPTLQCC
jgi:hypothetical protein